MARKQITVDRLMQMDQRSRVSAVLYKENILDRELLV